MRSIRDESEVEQEVLARCPDAPSVQTLGGERDASGKMDGDFEIVMEPRARPVHAHHREPVEAESGGRSSGRHR